MAGPRIETPGGSHKLFGNSGARGPAMHEPIRVGAVNYLNSKPLIHNLAALAPGIDLRLDVPSRLADQLAAGELDVALIPVIEYFRGENYTLIPNIAIASRGPVLSVTLFSRVPWPDIRSVSLDAGSRTSAALTQIILRFRYEERPTIRPLSMDADPESADTDAVLLIGDRAMRACLPGFRYAYDLGQEWFEWTGRPFVYAVWAVRGGADLDGIDTVLHEAKRQGLAHVGEIAVAEAPRLGLDAGFCRRYLETLIRFDLGAPELAGLNHFYDLAAELGLAPRGVRLDWYHRPHLVESR